ncbi:MAG: DeoR family transcriptional regulator, partial [Anaerovoracaceae bacterium]|nr:DeoR family transcriptional regulator [Anaerovoracaceae bacterium]
MLQEERFNRILAELDSNGAVKSVKLAELLDVSESTVRRDINELDAKGRLKKVFGGAVRIGNDVSTFEEDVAAKSLYHRTEKDEIARYAAGLIEDGDMVY